MRNLILALAATAFGVTGAQALPAVDSSNLVSTSVNPAIEKTAIVIVKKIVRPARTVCTTRRGPLGRVVKTCRTVR